MTITAGGLFAGFGGLEMALHAAFGDVDFRWLCEYEPATERTPKPRNAAAKVLAHRFDGVPNLGDVTAVPWSSVEPVDILAGGYPCQSQSVAGLQLGQSDDRWMWPSYRAAIQAIRPLVAVGENVEGHVQMDLRTVIADLQQDGYTVVWVTIAASDVGACHRRRRVFWLAWREEAGAPTITGPQFADLHGDVWGVDDLFGWSPVGDWAYHGAAYHGAEPSVPLLKTTTSNLADNGGSQHPDKRRAGGHGPTLADQVEHLLPTPRTTDTHGTGLHGQGGLDLRTAVSLLPTPTARDYKGHNQRQDSTCLTGALMPTPRASDAEKGGPNQRGSSGDLTVPSAVQAGAFGRYAEAIRRHEAAFGRPAPSPTGPYGRNDEPRLSGRFTEWMMALPDGWVTDVPGVTNKDAIRLCGNGVVWPQGAAAFRYLLSLAPASLLIGVAA